MNHYPKIEEFLMIVCRKSFQRSNIGQTLAKLLFVTFSSKGLSHAQLSEIYTPFIDQVCLSFRDMLSHQFALMLPILREILLSNHPDTLQTSAIFLIERHILYPSDSLISTLIFLIGNSQLYLKRARDALLLYCARIHAQNEYSNLEVLVDSYLSDSVEVRSACVEGLSKIWNLDIVDTPKAISRIWLTQFDPIKEISEIGHHLYDRLNNKLERIHIEVLLPLLGNTEKVIRSITARSISASLALYPESLVHAKLFEFYKSHVPDEIQKKYEATLISSWHHQREGVALCLAECSDLDHTAEQISSVFIFLIDQALRDENDVVHSEFVSAGKRLTDQLGKIHNSSLFPIFKKFLSKPSSGADVRIRECRYLYGWISSFRSSNYGENICGYRNI